MAVPEDELLKSPEREKAEEEPERKESKEISESDVSLENIVPVIEEELGSEISKSITVILKSVTHRGTQTVVHCRSDETKDNFFEMIINTRV